MKLWDTEAAARAIAPIAGAETVVVSLQNGVEKDELIGSIAAEGSSSSGSAAPSSGARIEPGVATPVHRALFAALAPYAEGAPGVGGAAS